MKFDKINESSTKRRESARESRIDRLIESADNVSEKTLPIDRVFEYTDENGNGQPYDIDERKVDALAVSIAESGQLEPVIVREYNGIYQLLAGHHRLAALRKNNAEEIAVKIVECSEWEAYRIVVESNIKHGSPKPSEISNILVKYKSHSSDEKVTNKMLAETFDMSERQIYRCLKMQQLTAEINNRIDEEFISTNSVDDLVTLTAEKQQILAEYFDFYEKALNVAACKKAVSFLSENSNADLDDLCEFMTSKKKKKKYKNEIFNKMMEDSELAQELGRHTEEELSELVEKLLSEHFKNTNTEE